MKHHGVSRGVALVGAALATLCTAPGVMAEEQSAESTSPTAQVAADEPGLDAPSQDESDDVTPKTKGWLLEGGIMVGSVGGAMARGGDRMYKLAGPMMLGALGAGYRFDRFLVGGRVIGGVGSPPAEGALEGCGDDDVECKSAVVRYSLLARVYLLPGNQFDPWVGIGFGRELFVMNVSVEDEPAFSASAEGAELLNLSAGIDMWRKDDQVASAFVDYGLGSYSKIGIEAEDYTVGPDDRTFHHWILLGASIGFAL